VIFVDTGAWYALAVQNDPDHKAAIAWLRSNRENLLTTDYVLAEIATLIRMRDKSARGHRTAVSVANSLIRQDSAYMEKIAADDIAAGFSIFRKYSDHWFSFVDCTSFAVIERLGISQAFAFDGHFDQYPGIRRVP
jgi:predicted nucleic acid-binding protein